MTSEPNPKPTEQLKRYTLWKQDGAGYNSMIPSPNGEYYLVSDVQELLKDKARLERLCDDAYGFVLEHHNDGVLEPDVCPICTGPLRRILDELEGIRIQRNRDAAMKKGTP